LAAGSRPSSAPCCGRSWRESSVVCMSADIVDPRMLDHALFYFAAAADNPKPALLTCRCSESHYDFR